MVKYWDWQQKCISIRSVGKKWYLTNSTFLVPIHVDEKHGCFNLKTTLFLLHCT